MGKVSRATAWHRKRTRLILKKGMNPDFTTSSWTTKFSLIAFPLVQLLACAACSYLSVWEILLLAYSLGSLSVMYIFSNAHEIFHGTISPCLNGPKFKNFFLRFATIMDITPGLYLYYKFGHGPHHAVQGQHKLDQIKGDLFAREMDVDPITNFKNLYKFSSVEGGELRYRFPSVETNRWTRLFVIFGMPFIDSVLEFVLEPFRFAALYLTVKDERVKGVVADVGFQHLLMLIFQIALGLWVGDFHFLLYLFFSRAFFLGFLHPYALMWLAIHKSVDSEGAYQPATSIRGRLATFLCAGINLHMEHHDAPWVSRSRLHRVATEVPELYEGTHSFANFRAVWKFILQPEYENVYSP